MLAYDPNSLQDLLPLYYKRIFPVNLFYRWLSYGNDALFAHREFSFTLVGDVYIRYLSFDNETEFEKELKKRNPEKIDIGAVYNQKPKDRNSTGFLPEEKEFVLDIDLTDYDDVRTCCSGATVCPKCWKFIGVAVEILDASLREDFGFKHLLWVFSGRRGVHCWVCDKNARKLDTAGRSCVIEYLQVVKGGDEKAKKVVIPADRTDRVHPFIRNAINKINEHFEEICLEDQEIFDIDKNLEMLPLECKKAALASGDRWHNILNYVKENKGIRKLKHLPDELKLQFCYPRLDINVSKGFNHLLKAPFCVHPKTGQVCVPFDPKNVFSFKISEVPNITQLINDIGEYDKLHGNELGRTDFKKTSLEQNMNIFKTFIKTLEAETKKMKIKVEPGDSLTF